MQETTTTTEIWKDVIGYEGEYMVSNLARIKSLKYGRETILKKNVHNQRASVMLSKGGVTKRFNVYRLVAKAFIPNPNNLPQVNHIDENSLNDVVWNLEWCDSEYNNRYGTHPERISVSHTGDNNPMYGVRGGASPSAVRVVSTRTDNGEVEYWDSITDFFTAYNLKPSPGNISKVCRGKTKTAYGRTWKYA